MNKKAIIKHMIGLHEKDVNPHTAAGAHAQVCLQYWQGRLEQIEIEENRQFVETNGREFAANEGICLTCYRPSEFTKVEGVPGFLRWFDKDQWGRVWDDEGMDFTGEKGVIIYYQRTNNTGV